LIKTLLDWLHVMATVIWIGGMILVFTVVRPVAMKVLDPESMGKFIRALMARFRIMVYVSIVLLGVTGIPLKIVNENYVSIINFENSWEIVSFIKHLFYGLLVILAIINFEILTPMIARLASAGPSGKLGKLQKLSMMAGGLAMMSALVILVLSSMMRFL